MTWRHTFMLCFLIAFYFACCALGDMVFPKKEAHVVELSSAKECAAVALAITGQNLNCWLDGENCRCKGLIKKKEIRDEKLDVWLRARELIREMDCQCPAR